MKTINLTIIVKTCGDRTATVALLESGGYKKAIVKCLPDANFKDTFAEAIGKLNQQSIVNIKTNKRGAEVQNLIMKENNKQNHMVFLQPNFKSESLEWLTYEIALQNGSDSVIMDNILKA